MRILALLVVAALNGALLWGWRDGQRRRDELLQRSEEIESQGAENREAAEHARDVEALLETARRRLSEEALDIDVLRDLLVAEERGLDIDRLSLEFHPESSLPAGVSGGAIQATLEGSFDAVYRYLARVEALHLPLAPAELSLRRAAQGERLLLSVRWSASWSVAPAAMPKEFTPTELSGLSRWIAKEPLSVPERNPFVRARKMDFEARDPEGPEPAVERPLVSTAPIEPMPRAVPRLTGYVLARPEVEADPSRRVLAALRFEGELWLVKVGDVVGSFRVERIEPRESVLLVDERTGEQLKLFLE